MKYNSYRHFSLWNRFSRCTEVQYNVISHHFLDSYNASVLPKWNHPYFKLIIHQPSRRTSPLRTMSALFTLQPLLKCSKFATFPVFLLLSISGSLSWMQETGFGGKLRLVIFSIRSMMDVMDGFSSCSHWKWIIISCIKHSMHMPWCCKFVQTLEWNWWIIVILRISISVTVEILWEIKL